MPPDIDAAYFPSDAAFRLPRLFHAAILILIRLSFFFIDIDWLFIIFISLTLEDLADSYYIYLRCFHADYFSHYLAAAAVISFAGYARC
jgi:hypothetical protein